MPGGRARDSAGRLLPAARGRRHRAAGVVLAPLRGDRECRRDQDRAVQSLSDARRGARRRRSRRRRPDHALHRQRRSHRARSADAVRGRCATASAGTVRIKGGLLGHWSVWVSKARSSCSSAFTRRSLPAPSRRNCWRSTRRSPIATPRSSMSPTISTACIAGCHEILRRQGLLAGIWCLDPARNAGARAEGRDRPRLRGLSASQRRCVRAAKSRAVAVVMRRRVNWPPEQAVPYTMPPLPTVGLRE